jgi:hypothetical protein
MASKEKNLSILEKARGFKNAPWCEEYEKMISGMLYVHLLFEQISVLSGLESRYNCLIPELVEGRFRARKFAMKYNTYCPDDATPESLLEGREVMLKEVIGSLGPRSYIEPPFNIDYGCNISIGSDFYSNFKSVLTILLQFCKTDW